MLKNTFAPTGGYLIICSRELLGLAFGLSCEAEDLGGGCHGRGERERQAEEKKEHRERDDKLHDALEDSFPASDPPPMRQPRHKSGPPKDKKSPQIQK